MAADVHTQAISLTALHSAWRDVRLCSFPQARRHCGAVGKDSAEKKARDCTAYCIMRVPQSQCVSSSAASRAERRREAATEAPITSAQVDKGADQQLLLPRLSSPTASESGLEGITAGWGPPLAPHHPPSTLPTAAHMCWTESPTALPNGLGVTQTCSDPIGSVARTVLAPPGQLQLKTQADGLRRAPTSLSVKYGPR